MKDRISPEEKLLRLIKGDLPAPLKEERSLERDASRGRTFVAATSTRAYRFTAWEHGCIIVGFVVAIGFLYYALVQGSLGDAGLMHTGSEGNAVYKGKVIHVPLRPVEEYLAEVEGKDVFMVASGVSKEDAPAQAAVDEIKDISVVGIVSGDKPQVVIEDKKNQKTYYLTAGQSFGNLVVDRIESGKVIVSSQGKQYELYL